MMMVKPLPNSTGIAVILPSSSAESFEKWKRLNGWKQKRWNYYNEDTKQYKTFEELHQEFMKESRKQRIG